MKTLIQFILLQLIFSLSLQSQNLYQRTYGVSNNNEFGYVVNATEDGGALLLNRVSNSNSASYDMQLIKIDENGDILWEEIYETPNQEEDLYLFVLPSGDYLIGALVTLPTGGDEFHTLRINGTTREVVLSTNYDINKEFFIDATRGMDGSIVVLTYHNFNHHLTAFNEAGEQIWRNSASFNLNKLHAASDGGYILSGQNGDEGLMMYKIDSEGKKEWEQYSDLEDLSYEISYRILFTKDEGYIVSGRTESNQIIVKVNKDREEVWSNVVDFDDVSDSEPLDITETFDGNYVAVSSIESDGYVRMLNASGEPLWSVNLDYGRTDFTQSVTQLSNGNLLVLGYTDSFDGSGNDILLTAFSTEGEELWRKTYGAKGNKDRERAFTLTSTPSGDYMLFGFTESFNNEGHSDWYLLNIDGIDGSLNWQKTYDFGRSRDIGYTIKSIRSGGYILHGFMQPNDSEANSTMQLAKIDEEGEIIWSNSYETLVGDLSYALDHTKDGGFIIAGNDNNENVHYIKTNENGEVQWEEHFWAREAHEVIEVNEGGFLIISEIPISDASIELIKTDESGSIEWRKAIVDYDVLFFTIFNAIQTKNDEYIIVGNKLDFDNRITKMYIAKISQEGDILWQRDITESDDHYSGFDVVETEDGDLVFAGSVRFERESILGRGLLLKTDGDGNEIWRKYYGEDVGTRATLASLHQNEDGSFALTGFINYQNSTDVYFLTTDSEGNTMTVNVFNPSLQYNFHIAPNPNNGQFQLSFEGEIGGKDLQLSILDLAGRQLEERAIPPISQQVDLSHLPSGTYFVKLGNGEQFSTKRVVIE